MLTIFTVPKPFEGHVGVIQRNAIHSWTRVRPGCQVVLFGDDMGTEEVAAELGTDWIPDVARNEFGTPLLKSVFRAAEERAAHKFLCYVNADIVLLPDFVEAIRRVAAANRRFLMVGQRWDIDVTEELSFEGSSWEMELRRRVEESGSLHPPLGSDYFVYPRGTIGPLPDFAVGRPGWDNWLIYHARSLRVSVVDATASVLVIHQNHGYAHIKQGSGVLWEGPEAEHNRALMGSKEHRFDLSDVTHRLSPDGLVRVRGDADLARRVRRAVILAPPLLQPVYRGIYRIARAAYRTLVVIRKAWPSRKA